MGGGLRHLTDMKEPRAQQETVGKVPQDYRLGILPPTPADIGRGKSRPWRRDSEPEAENFDQTQASPTH